MKIADYARLMSLYNSWMNEKLYEVCAGLPDEVRKADKKAPFRSIHGTLNHLLLTDRAWMGRFLHEPFYATSLDQILYDDFEELRQQRILEDERIDNYIQSLTDANFDATLRFTPMSRPVEVTLPVGLCIVHLFNHQTHHRGQLTTLLEQADCDFGVTDLPMMPGAADFWGTSG